MCQASQYVYNTHKYTRTIFISFFLFGLSVICNLWGSKEAITWRQREDAFYLSRACARWFATAILVSFDSPCGLSVGVSITEVRVVWAVWLGDLVQCVQMVYNLSSLQAFAVPREIRNPRYTQFIPPFG